MASEVRPSTYSNCKLCANVSDCKSRLRGKGVFLIDTLTNEVLDDDLRITYPIIDSLGREQFAMKEK